MKSCPYCRHDLPNDAVFCVHCGKTIEVIKEEKEQKMTKRQRSSTESKAVQLEKANRNYWTPFGIILFLVALLGFDGVLAMIFNSMNMDYNVVFVISAIIYVGTVFCGVMSILTDHKAKKENKQPTGNAMLAYAEIILSVYIVLTNVQQVILK